MQTFLPFPDFQKSAEALDDKRLGSQRNEAYCILKFCVQRKYEPEESWHGYHYHPAVKMWIGYEGRLKRYALDICQEWIDRGYEDTVKEKVWQVEHPALTCKPDNEVLNPDWLGMPEFHRSHKSNLVRKDPEHYRQHFPDVPNDLEYIWPEPK